MYDVIYLFSLVFVPFFYIQHHHTIGPLLSAVIMIFCIIIDLHRNYIYCLSMFILLFILIM
jgi:hypothetical protein